MLASAPAPFGVALIGAGAIGRMHVARCLRHPEVHIAAFADPTPAGQAHAQGLGLPQFADHRAMLDTAGSLLRFADGVAGTLITTDVAVAPWCWDLGVGEAEHYPQQGIDSHFISGTEASLSLLELTEPPCLA